MKVLNQIWIVLFVALILTSIPLVLADDETPVPGDVVVLSGTEVGQVDSNLQVNVVQVIIGLLGAFAAGGVVGIAGLAVFVDRIRNDHATVTALELLAQSFPPETRKLLKNASDTVTSIGELGSEVLDDIPIIDKIETVPLAGQG